MQVPPFVLKWIPQHWWLPRVRRLSRWFTGLNPQLVYALLACGLGIWMVANHYLEREDHIKHSDYDLMMKKRIFPPKLDPEIVILDIDEASLAKMNADFGRWPWPRDVLAAVLADLEKQGAKAVVFDILFADRDALSPNADLAFAQSVAKSKRSYFPVVRLPESADAVSQVKARELPGLVQVTDEKQGDTALAIIPPLFESIVKTTRMGTINAYLDRDGLLRDYTLVEEREGLRIFSLPARLAQDMGWPLPDIKDPLLRFMDTSLAFTRTSFADYFLDTQRTKRLRSSDEFKEKIVIVGATAPALFDLKATPIDRLHPGVEVLATAIDNLKNRRFVIEPPFGLSLAIGLIILCLMTLVALRWSHQSLSLAFVIAPTLLLIISYISLNFEYWFIDLSSVASVAFIFFSAIKLHHAELARRWKGENWHGPENDKVTGLLGMKMDLAELAKEKGFDQRLFEAFRKVAVHVVVTEMPQASLGWFGKDQGHQRIFYWALDDTLDEASARREARALWERLNKAAPLLEPDLVLIKANRDNIIDAKQIFLQRLWLSPMPGVAAALDETAGG
jgi:CHASE2 domain-containing sensor protein